MRSRLALLVPLALAATTAPAHADVITSTQTFGPSGAFSGGLTFPQFDPALGTLTRVTFDPFAVVSASVDLRNNTSIFRTANVRLSGLWEYQLPGVSATGPEPFGVGPRQFELSGSLGLAAGRVGNLNLGATTLNPLATTVGTGSRPVYVGTGTVPMTFRFLATTSVTPAGAFSSGVNFTESVTGTLTYEYEPAAPPMPSVPAPPGLVLAVAAAAVAPVFRAALRSRPA